MVNVGIDSKSFWLQGPCFFSCATQTFNKGQRRETGRHFLQQGNTGGWQEVTQSLSSGSQNIREIGSSPAWMQKEGCDFEDPLVKRFVTQIHKFWLFLRMERNAAFWVAVMESWKSIFRGSGRVSKGLPVGVLPTSPLPAPNQSVWRPL